MLIYEIPNYVQVTYNQAKDYILFDWTDFWVTVEDISMMHEAVLAVAKERQCFYYIAETSKARNVLRLEVLQWWGEWTPKLSAAGLSACVTVVPATSLGTMTTQSWQSLVVGNIIMKNFKNLSDAEAFIQELHQKAAE